MPARPQRQVDVVVRVRPLLPSEKLKPLGVELTKSTTKSKPHLVKLFRSLVFSSSPSSSTVEEERVEFEFEKCYDEKATQRTIFMRELVPSIQRVLEGQHVTVFAYGATGTGKTFTMEGNKRNLGMIPRCLKTLLENCEAQRASKKHIQVQVAFLEIYNDKVLDLFVSKAKQSDLPIRQHTDGNIVVQGLSHKTITTLQEFEELYAKGTSNRRTASTLLNDASSRSHCILLVELQCQDVVTGQWANGKMHLIDLAGSEDNRRAGNTGERLQESGKINMSLFVLGKVIAALNTDPSQRIPFRDSKLTRLLEDSLGGSHRAIMFCNIAPTQSMFQENLQTLKYALKAKGIVNIREVPPASTRGSQPTAGSSTRVSTYVSKSAQSKTNDANRNSTTPTLTQKTGARMTTPPSGGSISRSTAKEKKTNMSTLPLKNSLGGLPKERTPPSSLKAVSKIKQDSKTTTAKTLTTLRTIGATKTPAAKEPASMRRMSMATPRAPSIASGRLSATKPIRALPTNTATDGPIKSRPVSLKRSLSTLGGSLVGSKPLRVPAGTKKTPSPSLKRPRNEGSSCAFESNGITNRSSTSLSTILGGLGSTRLSSTNNQFNTVRVPLSTISRNDQESLKVSRITHLSESNQQHQQQQPQSKWQHISPQADKENQRRSVNVNDKTHHTLSPAKSQPEAVEEAKRLVSIALGFEKQQKAIFALVLFKRACWLLPETSEKLAERIASLEQKCREDFKTADCPLRLRCLLKDPTISTNEFLQELYEWCVLETFNSGSKAELMEIPTIGAKKAEKILETRQTVRSFEQMSELVVLPGFTSKMIGKIRDSSESYFKHLLNV